MNIKTKSIILGIALCTKPIFGAVFWYHGGTDNSSNFGVTPDSSESITWMDSYGSEFIANTPTLGNEFLQVNRPNLFGQNESVMLFGFDGTGLNSVDVESVNLHLRQSFSSPSQTWNIAGIPSADAGWDNSMMTWNTDGVDGWSGTTLGGSVINSYGTFMTNSSATDTNISIDITDAFKAYLDGTISGIAFYNLTNSSSTNHLSNRLNVYSNDNLTASNRPGLEVTTVPEASVALFAVLSSLALLRRRRC